MARYRMLVTNPAEITNPAILAEFIDAKGNVTGQPQLRQVVWFIEYDGVSPYVPPAGCSIELDPGNTALGEIAP